MKLKGHIAERTLFLDRDGVINRRLEKRYVRTWEEFEFNPGVLKAIPVLNKYFIRTCIITNQRGIGRKLMTEADLERIHERMLAEINNNSGKIDAIYYCAKGYDEMPDCRKPDPWMGLQAKKDFPDIDFNKSMMVGDQSGDIEFAKNLNMASVWIPNHKDLVWEISTYSPDHKFNDLLMFAMKIEEDNGKNI